MGSSTPPPAARTWPVRSLGSRARRAGPACCARPGGRARAGRSGGRSWRYYQQARAAVTSAVGMSSNQRPRESLSVTGTEIVHVAPGRRNGAAVRWAMACGSPVTRTPQRDKRPQPEALKEGAGAVSDRPGSSILPRGGQTREPPVFRRRDALGGRVRVGNPDDVAVLGL